LCADGILRAVIDFSCGRRLFSWRRRYTRCLDARSGRVRWIWTGLRSAWLRPLFPPPTRTGTAPAERATEKKQRTEHLSTRSLAALFTICCFASALPALRIHSVYRNTCDTRSSGTRASFVGLRGDLCHA
jgi:hypothetical protein